jgi:phosphopentomutase
MRGEHNIGRIIARPFVGKGKGHFSRTANRRDLSVRPTGETIVERIHRSGKQVASVGKIADIFDRVGIDLEIRSESNSDGMAKTLDLIRYSEADLIFTNLVDFDSKYGHRNDVHGYGKALEKFDEELRPMLEALRPGDLLFITADHGCDPTDVSTDHTREYVPMIVAGDPVKSPANLGIRETFGDLGVTVAEYLDVSTSEMAGTSVLGDLRREDR